MFSPILVPRLSPGTCGFRPARRGFRFRLAVALFLGALSVWLAAEPGPDRVSLTNQSDRAWTLLTSATNRARTSLAVDRLDGNPPARVTTTSLYLPPGKTIELVCPPGQAFKVALPIETAPKHTNPYFYRLVLDTQSGEPMVGFIRNGKKTPAGYSSPFRFAGREVWITRSGWELSSAAPPAPAVAPPPEAAPLQAPAAPAGTASSRGGIKRKPEEELKGPPAHLLREESGRPAPAPAPGHGGFGPYVPGVRTARLVNQSSKPWLLEFLHPIDPAHPDLWRRGSAGYRAVRTADRHPPGVGDGRPCYVLPPHKEYFLTVPPGAPGVGFRPWSSDETDPSGNPHGFTVLFSKEPGTPPQYTLDEYGKQVLESPGRFFETVEFLPDCLVLRRAGWDPILVRSNLNREFPPAASPSASPSSTDSGSPSP